VVQESEGPAEDAAAEIGRRGQAGAPRSLIR
jgi:hypothetical protein